MSGAVQQIKDRLSIQEVVSAYLKLEPAGANFKAPCPFHQEKTPSFFVSPARGSYHCFGCNRGGDLISFVQEIEGLDFMGALKILADRAGIELDARGLQQDPNKEKIYQALEAAARYYSEILSGTPEVLHYLTDRGVKPETVAAFRIGFARPEWQGLYNHLASLDIPDKIMEEAGLVIRSQKPGSRERLYDRFRGRIMFPLNDSSGRVVGFSGRVFGPEQEGVGKYINSPQTGVYDKSRVLYGFDRAKVAIRSRNEAVLVEGQFDLILSHQAGLANTVAVSGTALTRTHLEALGRLTKNVVMAFDGDKAGLGASARAIELALEAGLEVKAVRLPEGVDPADLIGRDPAAWSGLVAEAKHVIDFLLEAVVSRNLEPRAQAHAIKAEVYPYIARLRERIDQAHFVARVAEITGLPDTVIRDDIAAIRLGAAPAVPRPHAESKPQMSRREKIEEKLAGLHWWRPGLVDRDDVPFMAALERLAARQSELVMQAEILYSQMSPPDLKREAAVLGVEWEREFLKSELEKTMRRLSEAERKNELSLVEEYLKECQAISQKINKLQVTT